MAGKMICTKKCFVGDNGGHLYQVGDELKTQHKPNKHFKEFNQRPVPSEDASPQGEVSPPSTDKEPETLKDILDRDEAANKEVSMPDAANGDRPSREGNTNMFE